VPRPAVLLGAGWHGGKSRGLMAKKGKAREITLHHHQSAPTRDAQPQSRMLSPKGGCPDPAVPNLQRFLAGVGAAVPLLRLRLRGWYLG